MDRVGIGWFDPADRYQGEKQRRRLERFRAGCCFAQVVHTTQWLHVASMQTCRTLSACQIQMAKSIGLDDVKITLRPCVLYVLLNVGHASASWLGVQLRMLVFSQY